MDHIGLITLREELREDCRVAAEAFRLAQTRFTAGTDAALEGCAHHVVRFYNIIEQMGLRIAKAFENHIDDDSGWHSELIRRSSTPIQGIRPAFFPAELRQPLQELRAFRHVIHHAYDLELDCEKLALVLKCAARVEPVLTALCEDFVRQIAVQENYPGFDPPPPAKNNV
jgi:hypothetical protein